MIRRGTVFILAAIAAVGAAFARSPQSAPAAGERIAALVARHGDQLTGRQAIGNALIIYTVSSKTCRGIKILPVSVLLQETTLLRQVGAEGDDRHFVYLQDRWSFAGPPPVAPKFVLQQFLQMTRLQQSEIRWVLLGALPGVVLLLGGLVWMARRK